MILAVTGLRREARIVAREGVVVFSGGGDARLLAQKLAAAMSPRIKGVISIGIAGALSPSLAIGDCVIGSHVEAGSERYAADARWVASLKTKLPRSTAGIIAGSDTIAGAVAEKTALRSATRADAVDMESHIAARAAATYYVPFAALRVISDSAAQALPPAARVAMKPGGGIDMGAVVRSVLAEPTQVSDLIRTARHSEIAFASLLRCVDFLGPGLACPYLG